MKTVKTLGPSEISQELITARRAVVMQVMAEICKKVLDGFEMQAEWDLSIVVPIFKGKGDIRNCSCYRAVKLLEHRMKVVERLLEKRLHIIVTVDEMQFVLMPERGTIDVVYILRRIQEEHHVKGKKLNMCFVDLEKALDRVLGKCWNGK